MFEFLHKDYLGSIIAISNEEATLIEKRAFNAWGETVFLQDVDGNNLEQLTVMDRGYTGHEHLAGINLINMNARLYDTKVHRFLAPDNYIQDLYNTQNYNRYSYVLNSPLSHVDPSGNLLLEWALFSTETGYDIQKFISPVALKFNIALGTHVSGIGVQTSIGMPQMGSLNARVHGGIGYYSKNWHVTPGWQTTYGYEVGATLPIAGHVTYGRTTYNSPGTKFDQTIGVIRLGKPGFNIKTENDFFGDKGDKYRTGAGKIQIGMIHVGANMFTGEPNRTGRVGSTQVIEGNETYVPFNGYNPDEYRTGALYIRIGPFSLGNDSENTRHKIQNLIIHRKITGTPFFKKLNSPDKFFFQFGTFGGPLY